jgi:hypothetical protein
MAPGYLDKGGFMGENELFFADESIKCSAYLE